MWTSRLGRATWMATLGQGLLLTTAAVGAPCAWAITPRDPAQSHRRELVAEGWRRLTMERHYTRAQMERAWDPVAQAVALYLASQPHLWVEDDEPLKGALNKMLAGALGTGRLGQIASFVHGGATGDRELRIITLYASCRIGDVPSGRSIGPAVTVLFWRAAGAVRHQVVWDLCTADRPSFLGDGLIKGSRLILVGAFGSGDRGYPEFLFYALREGRWRLVQYEVAEDAGLGAEFAGPKGDVTSEIRFMWYRWDDDTLGTGHSGPHRYHMDRWVFLDGRYHRVSSCLVQTPFVTMDDLERELLRGHLEAARRCVASSSILTQAIKMGVGDPDIAWTTWFGRMAGSEWRGEPQEEGECGRTLSVRMRRSGGRWVITSIAANPQRPCAAPLCPDPTSQRSQPAGNRQALVRTTLIPTVVDSIGVVRSSVTQWECRGPT
jgi:hypothetical protein